MGKPLLPVPWPVPSDTDVRINANIPQEVLNQLRAIFPFHGLHTLLVQSTYNDLLNHCKSHGITSYELGNFDLLIAFVRSRADTRPAGQSHPRDERGGTPGVLQAHTASSDDTPGVQEKSPGRSGGGRRAGEVLKKTSRQGQVGR